MLDQFRHPANGHVVSAAGPLSPLWCLLICPLYLAVKGLWGHAVLAFFTSPLSWIIYPFFVRHLIREHYLKAGWLEVVKPPQPEGRLGTGLVVIGAVALLLVGIWLIGVLGHAPEPAGKAGQVTDGRRGLKAAGESR